MAYYNEIIALVWSGS